MDFVRGQHIPWWQVGFPNVHHPISQHESALLVTNTDSGVSRLEVNIWDLVFYATSLQDVWTPEGGGGQMSGIHVYSMLGRVLAVLEYARKAYGHVGFDGTVEVVTAFQRVRGVPIYAFPSSFLEEAGVSRVDDDIRFAVAVSTDRLRLARDAVASDILNSVLFALAFRRHCGADDDVGLAARLLDSAYGYNFWDKSALP